MARLKYSTMLETNPNILTADDLMRRNQKETWKKYKNIGGRSAGSISN